MKRLTILIAAYLLFFAISAFADGGGGMMFGYQATDYPFLENYGIRDNDLGLIYYGGYGYGIDRRGNITGGFGVAIMDPGMEETGISGGFGGVINGYRLIKRPLTIDALLFTGFGGISTGTYETESGGSGFFGLFLELDLEVGIPVTSWFMPVIYAGYQVIGNLIPGDFFSHFISYAPVIGGRVSWGKMY